MPRSDRPLLQLAPLALGQAAPDPEALVVGQGVLQALTADVTGQTDLLRLAGRAALLGEERLGIGLGAERPLLPPELLRLLVGLLAERGLDDEQLLHGHSPFD